MCTHKVLHMPKWDPNYSIFMYTICIIINCRYSKELSVLCIEVVRYNTIPV